MNRNKRRLRIYVLWIADLVVTIAAYGISLIISYGPFGHYSLAQRYVFLVMALVSTGISLLFSLNTNYMGRTWPDELGAVIVHNFILEICVIVFFFLMHSSTDISRLTFGRFLLINIIAMFAERMTLKEIARHVYGRDQFRKKC
jgi:FlaA1/EpsC-like NDP-sugar epimerase